MTARLSNRQRQLSEDHVWVFDLDNTLYAAKTNLFAQVDQRIGAFVQQHLGLDPVSARQLQKRYLKDHGTTMAGMMANHGVAAEEFLAFVHDIDFDMLKTDSLLDRALGALSGRKIIHTNADATYGARVLDRLGIKDHFDGIFDILAASLLPKPDISGYHRLLDAYDVDPTRATMVEDMARNLVPARSLGMITVWINAGCQWGQMDHDASAIDHEIEALTPWLAALTRVEGTDLETVNG